MKIIVILTVVLSFNLTGSMFGLKDLRGVSFDSSANAVSEDGSVLVCNSRVVTEVIYFFNYIIKGT